MAVVQGSRSHPSGEPELLHDPRSNRSCGCLIALPSTGALIHEMEQAKYSSEVRRFILAHIPSVPHLEALLLMRAEASIPWSGAALAARLYISHKVAEGLLEDLAAAGLVQADGDCGYTYRPAREELVGVVAELAAAYSRHVVEIAKLIHSISDRKAHRFADAFRWRKDS